MQSAQQAGTFLKEPRYPLFVALWIILLFLLAYIVAWLYASVRVTRGTGQKTAALVGLLVGFVAGFPTNSAIATWAPFSRHFPLWWMLELLGRSDSCRACRGLALSRSTSCLACEGLRFLGYKSIKDRWPRDTSVFAIMNASPTSTPIKSATALKVERNG